MRHVTLVLLALAALVVLPAVAVRSAEDDTPEFFNGKDLDNYEGLKQYWTLKDGALVGATPNGLEHNTFLCTKKKYRDFELSFKVRLKDGTGNSGVQIR